MGRESTIMKTTYSETSNTFHHTTNKIILNTKDTIECRSKLPPLFCPYQGNKCLDIFTPKEPLPGSFILKQLSAEPTASRSTIPKVWNSVTLRHNFGVLSNHLEFCLKYKVQTPPQSYQTRSSEEEAQQSAFLPFSAGISYVH